MRHISRITTVSLLLLLSACVRLPTPVVEKTTPVPLAPAATAPPAAPPGWQEQVRARGGALWKLDRDSLVAVTVRRAGALARLGHDHVVAARNLDGVAYPGGPGNPARAEFRFRLDAMAVDEDALRRQAGLPAAPAADAIAGTRHNMLVKVLDAERYPEVLVQAEQSSAGAINADITLHGVTRRYTFPADIVKTGNSIAATGQFTLLQTDFGIKPFAVFGGALAVQDRLELRFAIRASAAPAASR
jgi:polyisoprenoid-binding protein YceI